MQAPLTLLMIAFEFPPLNAVGVRRSLSLSHRLPAHGIRPVVITTDRPSLAAWTGQQLADDERLPPGGPVHRVPCPSPPPPPHPWLRRPWHYFGLGGDVGTCWAGPLTSAWDRIVDDAKPSAVYVSLPPFRLAPLAITLAHRSRLPVILDFRDHWSQWGYAAYASRWHFARELRDERRCLDQADMVIGVTEQLVRDLQAAHPDVDAAKFHVVPNGSDDLGPFQMAAARSGEPFVIGHAGRFYYSPTQRSSVMQPWWQKSPRHWLQYSPRREDWLYRSPYFFFRALRHLFESRPELRARVRVRFAGELEDWFTGQVREFGLDDVVQHVGRLSHDECVAFEARCDALLVTSAKVEGGRDYCIASKTFEYLATGRPILGIVTEGEQRDFLASSGGAVTADADDVAASARAIEGLITGGAVPPRNDAFLSSYHRREASRRIAGLVRDLVTA